MSITDELQRLCAEGGSHTRIKYLRSKIKRATIAELRKLLRERGVRFNEFKLMTQWAGALGESVEAYPTDTFPDTLLVKHAYLTPKQAIAATLGRRTCHNEGDSSDFCCSECGVRMYMETDDTYTMITSDEHIIKRPNYCPNCGRRVQ